MDEQFGMKIWRLKKDTYGLLDSKFRNRISKVVRGIASLQGWFPILACFEKGALAVNIIQQRLINQSGILLGRCSFSNSLMELSAFCSQSSSNPMLAFKGRV